ncbi:MAG TPA: DUF5926 family protein [Pseudonocardiaceae bacterium]
MNEPRRSMVSRRAAVKRRTVSQESTGETPAGAVGPRQPCPCGSGRRYKACHGAAGGPAEVMVLRPFEGLAGEPELIALREFVPSATVRLPLLGQPSRDVVLGTVLPMAAAAVVRADGLGMVGMQVQTRSTDLGRDVARAIRWVLAAKPGDALITLPAEPADRALNADKLADLLDPADPLEPELHTDFQWWLPEDAEGGQPAETSSEVALSLERANAAIMPTARLTGADVRAAYWVDAGEKAHLRWVRPEPEETLLAALARLAVRGELDLGEGSRYAGSFRAHGLLVPVWDLDREMHAREWEEPAQLFARRLADTLADSGDLPLTEAERRARDGLRGRQITLR